MLSPPLANECYFDIAYIQRNSLIENIKLTWIYIWLKDIQRRIKGGIFQHFEADLLDLELIENRVFMSFETMTAEMYFKIITFS